MKLTEKQIERIKQVFLTANTDQYFDKSLPINDYVKTVQEIVEDE